MIPIAVSQRVEVVAAHGERRDALDQRWTAFLAACGLLAVAMPNQPDGALALARATGARGLLLTGGNDLVAYGGDAPERDDTEMALIEHAASLNLPVLGVCRGMQVIQHRHGVKLHAVEGHVAPSQRVAIDGAWHLVNSYHRFAAADSVEALEVWARAEDGVIEAVRHRHRPMVGIMWHPERIEPFAARDLALFRRLFASAAI